jgi:cholesterol transport system auxiliary component
MTSSFRRLRTPLLVAVAAVSLSACFGLGGKTPPFLLTLDAAAAPERRRRTHRG